MNILQVNTFDRGGGAEAVALGLHRAYRARGHSAHLAVRRKLTDEEGVLAIPETDGLNPLARFLVKGTARVNAISGRAGTWMRAVARPYAAWERLLGHEDFSFPATKSLLDLPSVKPDILQTHNLHGNYFDLRMLPEFCVRLPLLLTLHDAWPFSGHCAHSFACDRWRTGCGQCPDLSIYPPVARDATAFNWRRKRGIFARCRLFVSAPSSWLLNRAQQSILAPAIREARVIENGIDDAFFADLPQSEARGRLNLPQNAAILFFAANTVRKNEWKDFATIRAAFSIIAHALEGRPAILLALGDDAPDERIGQARLISLPFRSDPAEVFAYYRAADLYLHAARVETFSLTIAEAQAAGTPVIATAVGAVPERIVCASRNPVAISTGMLVEPGDAGAMANAALAILGDPVLARVLSGNAQLHARALYRRSRQAAAYLDWFESMLSQPA
ncbi:MAG: glycosyltransferase [Rhodospirillales bacterium]|nr:glycosyltransferase [Rhodospirillales bacterium]